MGRTASTLIAALAIVLPSGCDQGPTVVLDWDVDGISDAEEGRHDPGGPVDTDGDTTPDYLDLDSDNDTIPDSAEAGDGDIWTLATDWDNDTTPDFRDSDSDGNGVADGIEGAADIDGDTIPGFRDDDNDGDGLVDTVEIRGMPDDPPDSDGDTIMDFSDFDSDADAILDSYEGLVDTDGDSIPDYLDTDSDSDTIPDLEEAGDDDITSPPRDSDHDCVPDFRDLDSDSDGLDDAAETVLGTSACDEDTDADAAPDLVENALGTDPLDDDDSPRARGDFVFKVPYNDPESPPDPRLDPEPVEDHLVFSRDMPAMDVFFAIDASFSMSAELNNITSSIRTTIIPGVRAEVPDVWFGVGRFEDCTSCAYNMAMLQQMTDVITSVEVALTGWSVCGGRSPFTQMLYAIATGDLAPFSPWGGVTPTTWTCSSPGAYGWPCFRPGAVPVVVQFGDDPFSDGISLCSPGTTMTEAIEALNSICAKYIGVNSRSGTGSSHADMVTIAVGTGSVDPMGSPLVFDISSDGTGLGSQVVDAIASLAESTIVEFTTRLEDDPSDSVDVIADLVDHVVPSVVGGWPDPTDPTSICVGGLEADDLYPPFDGRNDSFTAVPPGTPLCFDIHLKQNWTVPATDSPQLFRGEIEVVGDGETVLDTRRLVFVVPVPAHDSPCP